MNKRTAWILLGMFVLISFGVIGTAITPNDSLPPAGLTFALQFSK